MPEAVVRELWTYPIKGCQGVAQDEIEVTRLGVRGDRGFSLWRAGELIDQKETPRVASIRARLDPTADTLTLRHEEAGELAHAIRSDGARRPGRWVLDEFETIDQGDEVAAWLSSILDLDVRLVATAEPWRINFPIPQMERLHQEPKQCFTAASPVSLANLASLEALSEQHGEPVPMDRFRMNVIVDGLAPYQEDTLESIESEDVHLLHVTPAERCVIVSTDQETGERDRRDLLRSLPRKPKEERFGSGRIFGTYLQVAREGTLRVGDRLRVG